MNIRQLIVARIKHDGSIDWLWQRIKSNAKAFASYEAYLNSLSDEELLDTFIRNEREGALLE